MDLGLKGRVVLVTGASGGIGRALAEAFAAEGARLVLTGNEQIAELERWLHDAGIPNAIAVHADTTDPISIEAAFDAARTHFGRVDVTIANAGKWTPEFALLHEASVERIRANVSTNLLGTIWTARAFFGTIARTGPHQDGSGASLAMIGSTAGRFGEKGHAEYAASKAGMYGLLRTLKNEIVELDPFARVNLIEPRLDRHAHGARGIGATGSHRTSRAHDAPAPTRSCARRRASRVVPRVARHVASRQRRNRHGRRRNGRPDAVGWEPDRRRLDSSSVAG